MKNIKSIIFNSESFKFDDSNYAKLDQINNYQQAQVFTDNGVRNLLTRNGYTLNS